MVYVDLRKMPRHVAIIMDGNGRWAQLTGQRRSEGHREGSKAVRRIVHAARRLGLPALTLYAFSEQNWARPDQEVEALMGLLREFLCSEYDGILDNKIRLRAIGRRQRLPAAVRDVLDALEDDSHDNDGMLLSLALSYGGREEIVDASRALARECAAGLRSPEELDISALERLLPSTEPGPVDMLIRTGGEQRISNFLLWGAAYAELLFSAKLWPDYDEADFFEALSSYQKRKRRFGCLDSDVALPQASVNIKDVGGPQPRQAEPGFSQEPAALTITAQAGRLDPRLAAQA